MRQLHAWLPLLRHWVAAACALIIITPAASALPPQEAPPSPDATEVGGPLVENTTWSRGASPYFVSDSVLVLTHAYARLGHIQLAEDVAQEGVSASLVRPAVPAGARRLGAHPRRIGVGVTR